MEQLERDSTGTLGCAQKLGQSPNSAPAGRVPFDGASPIFREEPRKRGSTEYRRIPPALIKL